MGTDASPPTEERVSDDRLQELINVYDGQAFRGDFVLALQELQRLRHYVATCGGTDNDGRCPMHHLAGVSPEPAAEPVSSIDYWQRRGHHAPLFSVGDPVRFLGVESEITEVRERQYRLHGGTIAWEHELERIPETKAEVRPPFCGYCGDAGTVPNNSPGAPDLPCPRCSLNGRAGE